MSGGYLVVGSLLAMIAGFGALAVGFVRVDPSTIYLGAGLVLAGYTMREIGLRMPY